MMDLEPVCYIFDRYAALQGMQPDLVLLNDAKDEEIVQVKI